jgi:hypothetical protein
MRHTFTVRQPNLSTTRAIFFNIPVEGASTHKIRAQKRGRRFAASKSNTAPRPLHWGDRVVQAGNACDQGLLQSNAKNKNSPTLSTLSLAVATSDSRNKRAVLFAPGKSAD